MAPCSDSNFFKGLNAAVIAREDIGSQPNEADPALLGVVIAYTIRF
jgi:hypothetical protein